MEDYEYLALLASLGDRATALAEARGLFATAHDVTASTPEDLYAARSRIADRIEALLGGAPARPELTVLRAAGVVAVDGDLAEFAGANGVTIAAGGASATIRLLWDDAALYVGADVADPDLWVAGTGRDGPLYDADAIEVLLDPDRSGGAIPDAEDRQVIVSAAGDLFDAARSGAYADATVTLGVSYAVALDGVIGDSAPDRGYAIEMAIPWTSLGVVPGADVVLGGDLALDDRSATALATNDWAGVRPYAQPYRWNDFRLSATAAAGGGPSSSGPVRTTGGCSCGVAGDGGAGPAAWMLAIALLTLRGRRRRSPRASLPGSQAKRWDDSMVQRRHVSG